MTIRYANGQTMQAALVVRYEDKIRVALAGSDDVTEFTDIHGTWVSEDCEPVQIDFSWHQGTAPAEYTEDDFICSDHLAAHLIHLLLNDEEEDEEGLAPLNPSTGSTASRMVV